MNEITEELLLGEIEDIFWIDEDFSVIFFQNDQTGSVYVKDGDNDEGKELFFDWKINDKGVLAINFKNQEEKIIFWKLNSFIEKEDTIHLKIQEYEKTNSSSKPKKTKEKTIYARPEEVLEEKIKENNIDLLKNVVEDYNIWNYSIISSSFLIFFLFVYIMINFIVIIKDFPFLFQLFLILVSTTFVFRPLFFISNKISYKIRYWIEKK